MKCPECGRSTFRSVLSELLAVAIGILCVVFAGVCGLGVAIYLLQILFPEL